MVLLCRGLKTKLSPGHSAPPSPPALPSAPWTPVQRTQLTLSQAYCTHHALGLECLPPISTFPLNATFSVTVLISKLDLPLNGQVKLYLSSGIYHFSFCSILTTPHLAHHFFIDKDTRPCITLFCPHLCNGPVNWGSTTTLFEQLGNVAYRGNSSPNILLWLRGRGGLEARTRPIPCPARCTTPLIFIYACCCCLSQHLTPP